MLFDITVDDDDVLVDDVVMMIFSLKSLGLEVDRVDGEEFDCQQQIQGHISDPHWNLLFHSTLVYLMIMRILLTASLILLVGGCHAFQPTCPPSFRRAATTSSLEIKMEMVASSLSISLPDTSRPLAPHTFAGMVEQGLLERFDKSQITRVLQSWRLLDQEYYHNVYVGDPSLQETSHMIQECHSYVPGLSIQPFWNPAEFDFGWAQELENSYPEIAAEFQAVTADLQSLQQQGNNIWAGALTEDASAYGQDWKTLVLMNRGTWDPINVNLFPKTSSAVQKAGVPVTEVFFASMKGPSKIERHTDFTNFVLTSHLAIDIPSNGQNKCRLTVGDTTNEWINGKCMVFDTVSFLLHQLDSLRSAPTISV